MLPQEPAYPSLALRVARWQQEVSQQTELYLRCQRRLNSQQSRHAMKLRSSTSRSTAPQNPACSAPSRRALVPTSANPRKPKRTPSNNAPPDVHHTTNKRRKVMDKGKSPMKPGGPNQKQTAGMPLPGPEGSKRRGRPLGSKNKPKFDDDDSDLEDNMARLMTKKLILTASGSQLQVPRSPSKRTATTSRSKSRGKHMNQPVLNHSVVVAMLANRQPPVLLRTVQEIREASINVPGNVLNLYNSVENVPLGSIPEELKVSLPRYQSLMLFF